MNIDVSLIGQAIAFILFIWLTKRFIWPHIIGAMEARESKIADGLAAAERGRRDLELAQEKAAQILLEARNKAGEIVDHANKRAGTIVDEAREQAKAERENQVAVAQNEIAQATNKAREALQRELAATAIVAAEKVLEREINPAAHKALLDEFSAQL